MYSQTLLGCQQFRTCQLQNHRHYYLHAIVITITVTSKVGKEGGWKKNGLTLMGPAAPFALASLRCLSQVT